MIRTSLKLICVLAFLAVGGLCAEPIAGPGRITRVASPPPIPSMVSPIANFRALLLMTPIERANALTNRPVEIRKRILSKVTEYLALDPDQRELRLKATELRWYLLPLLRTSPTNYASGLAQVPEDLLPLVESRLSQWRLLPPPLQKEFLENDRALPYFAHIEPTNAAAAAPPDDQRQRLAQQFSSFMDLTPMEKDRTLSSLSAEERARMAKTLQTFENMPQPQRLLCVKNFTKFAGMSPAARAEFLKNAEVWSKMSPKERQTWRDLVDHVPLWPPLPPNMLMPPLPPPLDRKVNHSAMATNQ